MNKRIEHFKRTFQGPNDVQCSQTSHTHINIHTSHVCLYVECICIISIFVRFLFRGLLCSHTIYTEYYEIALVLFQSSHRLNELQTVNGRRMSDENTQKNRERERERRTIFFPKQMCVALDDSALVRVTGLQKHTHTHQGFKQHEQNTKIYIIITIKTADTIQNTFCVR